MDSRRRLVTGHIASETIAARVDEIYRQESRKVYATLVRLLQGDFDLAEDSLHEAFAAAVARWPDEGVPANPYAWLVSAGRFKAIDVIRRRQRFSAALPQLAAERQATEEFVADGEQIEDDQLRLIFTCCHPALPQDAQVALTLREVCGLTTGEIARAYLTAPSTLAQRIVRAKAKIANDRIPYRTPEPEELADRLDAVLRVIYLIFNEGYSASFGPSLTRPGLSGEAIRLGRLMAGLQNDPEISGLLGLMLLNESRRPARISPEGALAPLEEQDRTRWNREMIEDGSRLAKAARASQRIGPFTIQALIASEHAKAADVASTDWSRIVALYDLLILVAPSPVVELNRAAAIAMRDDPATGLALIDAILDRGALANYHPAYSARADLLRRLDRTPEARAAYAQALKLVPQESERRLINRRLAELES